MSLSDYEESVIEEFELAFTEHDPSFALEFEPDAGEEEDSLRSSDPSYVRRTRDCSVFGCVAGIVIMLVYLTTSVAMAFVGATITLVSAIVLWSVYAKSAGTTNNDTKM